MTSAKDVMKMIADNAVKFLDLRFTRQPRAKEQHVSVPPRVCRRKVTHAMPSTLVDRRWKGIEPPTCC